LTKRKKKVIVRYPKIKEVKIEILSADKKKKICLKKRMVKK